jgi:integrase
MKQEQIILQLTNTEQILTQMLQLPKNKLVNIIKQAGKARKQKYENTEKQLYGNLPRSLNNKDKKRFFKGIHRHNTRKIFLIQYFYALRIGELYTIEYLKEQKLLKIYNQKADRIEYLPIHGKTIHLFETPIILPHIDNLRKTFNKTIKKIGLEYIYYKGPGYSLRQYTPHSLRHTAITKFMQHINNPLKAMHYSRHKNKKEYGSLPTYYYYTLDEMRKDLEKTFKTDYKLI